jgi:hypothetical protein
MGDYDMMIMMTWRGRCIDVGRLRFCLCFHTRISTGCLIIASNQTIRTALLTITYTVAATKTVIAAFYLFPTSVPNDFWVELKYQHVFDDLLRRHLVGVRLFQPEYVQIIGVGEKTRSLTHEILLALN